MSFNMIPKETIIKSVWILGGTSKVAQSICIELAEKGCKKFCLLSRNKIKSNKFSSFLRLKYDALVEEKYIDLEKNDYLDSKIFYKVSDFDLYVFTSVAADRGRPSNYFYGAAKSALEVYSEGLMARCFNKRLSVRIIKAGYMDTPMTNGKAPKFLCINTSVVAKRLLKNPFKRGIEYLPWFWNPIMSVIKKLPNKIISKL